LKFTKTSMTAEAVIGRFSVIDDEHVIPDTLALIFSNAAYDAGGDKSKRWNRSVGVIPPTISGTAKFATAS
jgi:hypothetical protein